MIILWIIPPPPQKRWDFSVPLLRQCKMPTCSFLGTVPFVCIVPSAAPTKTLALALCWSTPAEAMPSGEEAKLPAAEVEFGKRRMNLIKPMLIKKWELINFSNF